MEFCIISSSDIIIFLNLINFIIIWIVKFCYFELVVMYYSFFFFLGYFELVFNFVFIFNVIISIIIIVKI